MLFLLLLLTKWQPYLGFRRLSWVHIWIVILDSDFLFRWFDFPCSTNWSPRSHSRRLWSVVGVIGNLKQGFLALLADLLGLLQEFLALRPSIQASPCGYLRVVGWLCSLRPSCYGLDVQANVLDLNDVPLPTLREVQISLSLCNTRGHPCSCSLSGWVPSDPPFSRWAHAGNCLRVTISITAVIVFPGGVGRWFFHGGPHVVVLWATKFTYGRPLFVLGCVLQVITLMPSNFCVAPVW